MRRYMWEKRGQLMPAPSRMPWACSHAALPFAENANDGSIDLYYSPRDERGRAHVALARAEVVADGALMVIRNEPHPVLSPGALGAFDESGTTVSCVVHADGDTYLYYTGWTLGVTVPFYFYVGLAIRRRGDSAFHRVSDAAVLERNAVDPYLTASPWVLREEKLWRMWYVSGCGWELVDSKPRHRDGRVSIDLAGENEHAISRPCVVRDDDCYRMWFAARGDRYRLGYAESSDGLDWSRADALAGLEPSSAGWDSNMIAYPAILDHAGRRYLLYNGNDYGKTGIGYAVGTTDG
jgi:hypothetical protein